MHQRIVLTLSVLAAVALCACGQARKSESASAETARCTRCHGGTDNQTGAPPGALRGEGKDGSTAAMSVGAHSAHVQAGKLAAAFACTACHPDPRAGSTHLDGKVDLALDGFAHEPATTGPAPAFDANAGTCAVYCHGAFRGGNGGNTPIWNRVGQAQAACGSCHAAPPPAPHPTSADCGRCHSGYTAGSVNLATHVNGRIDLDGLACTSCHGDPARATSPAAPPMGTRGETATTERAVGAHQAHLNGASLGTSVACDDCHEVPASLAHANGSAELRFGPRATAGGTFSASFDGASCTTYCHGATLSGAGGSNTAPRWTGGVSEAACGACHGVPPPSPHPSVGADRTVCAACHPQTMTTAGALIPASAGGKHLDGTIQSSGHDAKWMDNTSPGFHAFSANADLASCTTCHGARLDGGSVKVACGKCHNLFPEVVSDWRGNCVMCHGRIDNLTGAPPRTTWGRGADAVRVGAHTTHLSGSDLAPAFDCGVCHVKPDDALSPGHVDGPTATVTFAGLATIGAAVPPVWDRASATCASTYCHGGTLSGGTNTRPVWTSVGAGEASCGTCHGLPPQAPHPFNLDCGRCHAGYTATSVNVATHVNGTTDVVGLTCASCHGDPARPRNPAAPPVGTRGETSTTQRAVGAHQAHLDGTSLAAPVACTECHDVPTSLTHPNGAVDLRFGALATRAGKVPASFNGTTCSNYCHGANLGGGSVAAPVWTGGSSQAVCGACHGLPPPSPHPAVSSDLSGCAGCHDKTVNASGTLIPAATGGKHLNGAVDGGCVGCHPLPANGNYWHSGSHGGNPSANTCQVCHEDATGLTSPGGVVTDVKLSTATTCGPLNNQPCAASHNNGVVTLTPQWSNYCFNCHGE
jgi:predicted CxxxxCH...CXXCH cytochrome family protein